MLLSITALSGSANARVTRGLAPFVSEPVSDWERLALVKEVLVLDLRPIALGHRAVIDATYRIRNDGAMMELNLLLPLHGTAVGTASLDGESLLPVVSPAMLDGESLPPIVPPEWTAPMALATLEGTPRDSSGYFHLPKRGFSFMFTIGPGEHTLRLRQEVNLARDYMSAFYTVYNLAYVLLPLRSWQSVGAVDVTVELPPDWLGESVPAMTRTGDTLQTTLLEPLSLDALSVVASPPPPSSPTVHRAVGFLAGLIAALLLGWVVGILLRIRERQTVSAWCITIGGALLGGYLANVIFMASNQIWMSSVLRLHLPPVMADAFDFAVLSGAASAIGAVTAALAIVKTRRGSAGEPIVVQSLCSKDKGCSACAK